MRGALGTVNAAGESCVPEGLVDLAAGGEDLVLDAQIEERLSQIFKDVSEGVTAKAKYKLEVAFTDNRSVMKPFGGFVVALTNGGFAHGGGDEAVYFCTAKVDRNGVTKQCCAPLDLKWIGKEAAVCPTCRNAIRPADLLGQVYAKLPMQHWATLITRVFHILDCNADLRIGVMHGDLRRATDKEQERYQGGDHFRQVRSRREWVVYPLANIIKDTANGSGLQSRIRAFLCA